MAAQAPLREDAAAAAPREGAVAGPTILIASYPKSGSTWVREIVAKALDEDEEAGTVVPPFQNAFPPPSLGCEVGGRRVRFARTHLGPDSRRFGLFEGELAGVVSIRRHPLDVVLSSLNYQVWKNRTAHLLGGAAKPVERMVADGDVAHYLDEFVARDGVPMFMGLCGPFSTYQRRWRARGVPYLELCYEDMVADPAEGVRAVLRFLGHPAPEGRVAHIEGLVNDATARDGEFFWKRRAFNFEAMLPPDLAARFNARVAPVLDELGYAGPGRAAGRGA